MNTFLPFSSFVLSARVLDNKRLGKQRVECLQLLNVLDIGPVREDGSKTPWYNHPACLMWVGYKRALQQYAAVVCHTWIDRGFRDTILPRVTGYERVEVELPPWLRLEDFHLSHKSNLIRKDPKRYGLLFGKDIPDNIPYYWPTKHKL